MSSILVLILLISTFKSFTVNQLTYTDRWNGMKMDYDIDSACSYIDKYD